VHPNSRSSPISERIARELVGLSWSPARAEDMALATRRIRDAYALPDLLADLSDADLAASTWHPNGFAKLVPHCANDQLGGCRLRVHVWPAHRDRTLDHVDPHGHRWDFASWILTGALREVKYKPAADGEAFERHAYRRDQAGHAHLVGEAPSVLAQVEVVELRAGTVYHRTRDVLHASTPPPSCGTAASLVLQGPHPALQTPVYRLPGSHDSAEERSLTQFELHAVLDELCAAIV
jgi:hypothetical protein